MNMIEMQSFLKRRYYKTSLQALQYIEGNMNNPEKVINSARSKDFKTLNSEILMDIVNKDIDDKSKIDRTIR